MSSIKDDNPVVYIDDRWLYNQTADVPEEPYFVPLGKGVIRREGKDITIAATSYMVIEAGKAAKVLEEDSVDVEVLDLRSLKPLDSELLLESVRKTGRLVVADGGWRTCGVAAEVSAIVVSDAFECLRSPVMRVTLPDAPAPASSALEKAYYSDAGCIVSAVKKVIGWRAKSGI